MTVEEVKDFLSRGYQAKERIKDKEERIEHWRQISESITVTIKPVTSFSSYPSKKVEECACNIIGLQNEILEEINGLIAVEREIAEAINAAPLTPIDKRLLELRYSNYYKWEEVAVEMKYAYRWIMRRHKKALQVISENWPF